MPDESVILTTVPAFVLAFALGLLALRLKLSPLLGYLGAGVLVGPFTPGWVAHGGAAEQMAEIGVVLLMFGVGLHFAPEDLLKVRRLAVPGALLQMALATGLAVALGGAVGLGLTEALLLGLCLSVASTVVVLRGLEERREVKTEAGRIAVGWLVVQDFLVILGLVLLPPLLRGRGEPADLALGVGWQLLKVAVFVALMLLVGGRALPWLLVRVAHTRSRELFTLGVLSIALGIAWLAYAVFSASFALGAFVAGLVLNGSKLGHNAAERSLPFRDAFAVMFFVSVGMLFDPGILARQPLALLGVVVILIVSGAFAAVLVAWIARVDRPHAALLAASLPQIGEFSFVLAGLGVSLGVMSRDTQALVIAAAILSIAINPLLMWTARWFARPGQPASGPPA